MAKRAGNRSGGYQTCREDAAQCVVVASVKSHSLVSLLLRRLLSSPSLCVKEMYGMS